MTKWGIIMTPKIEYKCPACKKKNRIKIVTEINKENVEKVITREIFKYNCKDCNESIYLDHELIIETDKYFILYLPTQPKDINVSSNKIMRICDTFDNLKEKLMIFEDDLFDITIEFIKDYIKSRLEEEALKDLEEIRYDGKNEENLLFYLLGVKKTVGIPISFYEEIFKKLKYKKINKCVLIDNNTYSNYYKMRLLK